MPKIYIALMMLVLQALVSCAQDVGILEIQKSVELLEKPYPMDYPSTNPKPNSVVKILEPQRVIVLEEIYEKDFLVFKVRDEAGDKGYVISDPSVRFISKQSSAQW